MRAHWTRNQKDQGHSRSKIKKKVRKWQIKSRRSSQRPPASVSNLIPPPSKLGPIEELEQ